MDNQSPGQDSRVETEGKAMVRTIEAGVLDFPPLSGFSVGYPA